MSLRKCPRCELNYILDGGELCTVCRKEVRGVHDEDDIAELCSECGENPVMPGSELCASCYKELMGRMQSDESEENEPREEPSLGIDSVSSMDEIDIGTDLNEDAPFGEVFDDDVDDEDDEEPDDEKLARDEEEDDDILDR
ncbi:MAG: hypothetical protein IKE30_08930 [Clostridia bacterium]|nr:hypothetical protein [Clostridia bacterium]